MKISKRFWLYLGIVLIVSIVIYLLLPKKSIFEYTLGEIKADDALKTKLYKETQDDYFLKDSDIIEKVLDTPNDSNHLTLREFHNNLLDASNNLSDIMWSGVKGKLIDKKIIDNNGNKSLSITFKLTNETGEDINGIKGYFEITDVFKANLGRYVHSSQEFIKKDSSILITSSWDYESNMRYSNSIEQSPLKDLSLFWMSETIVFADKTRLTRNYNDKYVREPI